MNFLLDFNDLNKQFEDLEEIFVGFYEEEKDSLEKTKSLKRQAQYYAYLFLRSMRIRPHLWNTQCLIYRWHS
jgi:hypothetical protein